MICQDCGGRKGRSESKRCGACYQFARKGNRDDIDGIMYSFNAAAFRRLLNRPDVEWSPELLAARTGLYPETITRWLSGARRPRVYQWHKVAAILAMEPCTHCNGAGVLEPTQEGLASVTRSVSHHAVALPTAQPVLYGDGWRGDPNALSLTIGTVTVGLTRREMALVTMVAQVGRFASAGEVAASLGISDHAVTTYLSRLRDKCAAAGVDLATAIENRRGAGYRVRIRSDVEAVS